MREEVMRWILTLFICILNVHAVFAQTTNPEKFLSYPFVSKSEGELFTIKGISFYPDSTVITLSVGNTNSKGESKEWLTLSPNIYLEAQKKKYSLIKADGVNLLPEKIYFSEAYEWKECKLLFPPLPSGLASANLIGDDSRSWALYDINLSSNVNESDLCIAVLNTVKFIHDQGDDQFAKRYLMQTKKLFESSGNTSIFFIYIGTLLSNIWNDTPDDSATVEYKGFLESIIDDEIMSDDYLPTENLLIDLWRFTHDYANMFYKEQKYEQALELLKQIHRWFQNYPSYKNTGVYARSLMDHCLILVRDLHRYGEGKEFVEEYCEIAKTVYGEKSNEYCVALYNKYLCLSSLNSGEDIDSLLIQALDIIRNLPEKDEETYKLLESTVSMMKALRTGQTDVMGLLDNKDGYSIQAAAVLVQAGKGAEALPALLSMKGEILSAERIDTISLLGVQNLIVQAYINSGDFSSAQNQIDSFHKRFNIDNLPDEFSQTMYSCLGVIAYQMKNYYTALNYMKTALNKYLKKGEADIEYSKLLSNVALAYIETGDKLRAKWYIDEASETFEEKVSSIDSNNNLALTLMNNLSLIYMQIGENSKAQEYLTKIAQSYNGNPNSISGWSLAVNNLAISYMQEKRYQEAVNLLKELNSENKETNSIFSANLALAYYAAGDKACIDVLNQYKDECINNSIDAFEYFTEAERENYWTNNARTLLISNTFAEKFPEGAGLAYDNILFSRRLNLLTSGIVRQYVEEVNNQELTDLYSEINGLKQKISYRNEEDSIRNWRVLLDRKEHELYSKINLKERFQKSFRTWKDIQTKLKDNEIAIEFTYLPKPSESILSEAEIYYAALLLDRKMEVPVFVPLCKREDLDSLVSQGNITSEIISDFYSGDKSFLVYEMVWKKLEQYLMNIKKIYFTPTGAINNINNSAICYALGHRLSEKYDFERLSSTAILAEGIKPYKISGNSSICLYGGINYDESVDDMKRNSNIVRPSDNPTLFSMRSEDDRGKWSLLPGTKKEVEEIESMMAKRNLSTALHMWDEANEESFKNLSGTSPEILHLSTHGFFLENTEQINKNAFMNSTGLYSWKNDQMIRTGLLLAGSNNVWTGKSAVDGGVEDGILTADEISRLDLRNTRLVVLSACETAKGHLDEIDGVLGLQRGFKKAGAGTIVMSLWTVPDIATTLLMSSLYKYLLQGYDIHQALTKSQRDLVASSAEYENPYYWAGFVVLD